MRLERDPARLLLRALRRSATAAGCAATFADAGSTPWCSATFNGAQHRIEVTGTDLDGWLVTLPDADLPIRDHIVASLAFALTSAGAMLCVLVLEA